QAEVAGALDGARELTLLPGGDCGDTARDDLAPFRNEPLKQADVLVIDLWRILARERARLAAAEECSGHYSTSSSRGRKSGPSPRSERRSRSVSARRSIADG